MSRATSSTQSRERASRDIPTLDGWRAVAILMVMVCHGSDFLFYAGGPWPSPVLHRITRLGAHGVDVFFAISGYLICTRLLSELERSATIRVRDFYVRRAFRLLPALYTYLVCLVVLMQGVGLPLSWSEVSATAFFYRNYLPAFSRGGESTGHFWSLAVEEHFYLLMPAMLLFFRRRVRWVFPAAAALVVLWRMVEYRWHLGARLFPSAEGPRTDLMLDYLFWGAGLAALRGQPEVERALQVLGRPWVWGATLVTLIALSYAQPHGAHVLTPLLTTLIVVGTVVGARAWPGRLLDRAALRWIGRMSYSLYIWQSLFLVGAREARPLALGPLRELPLSLVPLLLAALGSYYLIERPMIRIGHALTPGAARAVAKAQRQVV